MKKIMFIIISVVILFTACKESSTEQTEQNAYEKESFDGITFGMSKDEVITVIGRNPDYDYESDIEYENHIFLGVTTYDTYYFFDDNGNLDNIMASYTSYDESEKEQMLIDLEHIKGEISRYYPENTITRIDEEDNELFLFTESRVIRLKTYDNSFDVAIKTRD